MRDRYAAINARARILSYYLPRPHEEILKNEREPFERAKDEWLQHARRAIDEVAAMTFEQWKATREDFKSRKPDECFECGQQYRHSTAGCNSEEPDPSFGREMTFQKRVMPWMQACFGAEIAGDKTERNHRFLEEALELVQATGCTQGEAHQLVDYVFGRPTGEPAQEVGGVMVTLAALCLAQQMDMHNAGETELERIWTKVEQIRAKQAAKPRHSPMK